MSAIRIGRPRSIRASSVTIRAAANGSPDSAIVGGIEVRIRQARRRVAQLEQTWRRASGRHVTNPPVT